MPDHGAILIDSGRAGFAVADVVLENVRCTDTRAAASRSVGVIKSAGTMSNVLVRNVTLTGTRPATDFYTNTAGPSEYLLIDGKGPTSWGWEMLGSAAVTAPAVSAGVITIVPRQELMIVVFVPTMSANDVPALRFNGVTTATYAFRGLQAASGSATITRADLLTQTALPLSGVATNVPRHYTVNISNSTDWEKVGSSVPGSRSAGANAAAALTEFGGQVEWDNSTAQITSVELRTLGGTATMASGSRIIIYGRNAS